MTSFIGPYEFISLSNPPEGIKQQIALEFRAGVDGVLMRKTGVRGQPFRVRSVVDPPGLSLQDALTTGNELYRKYEELTDADPQPVMWASIPQNGALFQVLHTELLSLRGILGPRGGLNSGAAILEVAWTLIPIEVSEG